MENSVDKVVDKLWIDEWLDGREYPSVQGLLLDAAAVDGVGLEGDLLRYGMLRIVARAEEVMYFKPQGAAAVIERALVYLGGEEGVTDVRYR